MPNYKSVDDYTQRKARLKAVQDAQAKLPEVKARVERLRKLHSELCKKCGDSGSVRQQLEDAENSLEELQKVLKQPVSS
ncbi:hypothetical protein H6F98_20925 [Microcoleus sp. FACHB-SPT15]|uniref:hypothetical protein n=1 Tax=Microcoleus sp. FACHB-SPT15 TaxID=2692830 RepID=UPI00177FD56A|nr:hypothetical protein [Microcoleus sp. FACHB-SPT15]MBD1807895.1 hypothetical protein [Microcoleus sp. FACHB-SPT15]